MSRKTARQEVLAVLRETRAAFISWLLPTVITAVGGVLAAVVAFVVGGSLPAWVVEASWFLSLSLVSFLTWVVLLQRSRAGKSRPEPELDARSASHRRRVQALLKECAPGKNPTISTEQVNLLLALVDDMRDERPRDRVLAVLRADWTSISPWRRSAVNFRSALRQLEAIAEGPSERAVDSRGQAGRRRVFSWIPLGGSASVHPEPERRAPAQP